MSEESQSMESRRQFLKGTGLFVAAAALAGCAPKPAEAAEVQPAAETEKTIPAHPWTYVELDVEKVRKLGHQGYYNEHCCYGAFAGIVDALKEKVGYPFDQIPTHMMAFGAGGVAGWGTTCGALLGAAAAINLVLPFGEAAPVISELMGWYTTTPLPTKEANDTAVKGEYLQKELHFAGELPQAAAGSPLCHASISNWCLAAKKAANNPEALERCGRLTGDVAAKATELLNAKLAGKFEPAFKLDETTAGCLTCHAPGDSFEMGQITRGMQECTACHEPHN